MSKFTVRVYGILLRDKAVLVSDEAVMGKAITKFPGGGLEFGEGTLECLEREFYEELDVQIEIAGHFYTTDFYVPSAFDPNTQVVSVYYLVKTDKKIETAETNQPHHYKTNGGTQSFRWIPVDKLDEMDFTLMIDKKVSEMIRDKFAS